MRSRLARLFACIAFAALSQNAMAQERTRLITAREIATLRDLGGLSVSPDGRWAAFAITQADPDQNRTDISWHVFDLLNRNERQIADGGDLLYSVALGRRVEPNTPSLSAWSPDGLWLAYQRRDNGHTQVWRTRRDGSVTEQLTHNEADVSSLAVSRDGKLILFQTAPSEAQMAQALASEARRGFLYDERFIPLYSPLPVAARNADFIHWLSASQAAAQQIWAYDIASRRERLATEAERSEFTALTDPTHRAPHQFSRNVASPGGSVAWTEARDPERQGLRPPLTIVAQPTGSSSPVACTAPACTNIQISSRNGLLWRSDEEVLFVSDEGVAQQDRALYLWRPSRAEPPRPVLKTLGQLPGCAIAQGKLLCLIAQPDHPVRLVAVDLDSGALDTLFDPNPDFTHFNLGPPPRLLDIRAPSGVETSGYLVLPPHRRAGERLPLVIVTYACPGFLRGGTGDEYPIYPFAAQGFAVLCLNEPIDREQRARLRGDAYVAWEFGGGDARRHRIEDALDAIISQLDREGVINPDRVAMTGLSFGAEMTGIALPHMPRLAAAISSGFLGPGAGQYPYLGPTVQARYRSMGVGRPDQNPERWSMLSFGSHVADVYAPVLLNVADHELIENLDAVTALGNSGRAVEMYVFPDEYHVKWQPAHRLAIYNRNIDWLNFWLRGVESGLTGDATQYTRWRAMREQQCHLFGPGGTEFRADAVPWYCRPGALPASAAASAPAHH